MVSRNPDERNSMSLTTYSTELLGLVGCTLTRLHSMTLRPRHKLIFLAGAAPRTEYFISGDCSSLYALTSTMQTLHKTSTFRANSRPFRENGQKL